MPSQTQDRVYEYVDDSPGLQALVKSIKNTPRIAIDTEADSLHSYYEKVCLIQLSFDSQHAIVDPLADVDLRALLNALANTSLVLHGADYDLRMLYSTFGFVPKSGVFDTALAAQLLGCERTGLAYLVERFFDYSLTKRGQKSDWSKRPLTKAQLDYACDDTRFLLTLANLLEEDLRARGRIDWHREACERLVKTTTTAAATPASNDENWRIKGTSTLRPRELGYLRELWHWREREAQKADIPPFKVLANAQLTELATWAAAHPDARLESGPKLPRTCRDGRFRALQSAVRRAKRLPQQKLPSTHRKRTGERRPPERRTKADALRVACRKMARELNLDPGVLVSRQSLFCIVEHDARTSKAMQTRCGLMRWQAELLESTVAETLKRFD